MAFHNKFVSELSEEQKAALEELQGEGYTARIGQRAQAILLNARGYTMDEISALTECHRTTVSHWLNNWEERGIDGLLEREGRGRKRLLTEDEGSQVIGWLEESPNTARGLAIKIEEVFDKKVSLDTVRRLIKRQGKVWKRVRSTLPGEPDEEEYRQCEQELIEYMVAAVDGGIDLFYFDESGFGRTPYIPYAWQDRGTTLEVPCREGKRINVMGAYSLMAGDIQVEMLDRNITSADVISYFDKLSERLEKFSVLVIDNASIHTANKVKEKLAEWEEKGLYIYYLPTYSPELNIVEMVWRLVKYRWLPLNAYASFESLWENLKDVFYEIGRKHILYLA
jgi:transposase